MVQAQELTFDMGWNGRFRDIRFTVRRDTKDRWWFIKRSWFLIFVGKPVEFDLSNYSGVVEERWA